MPLTFPDNPQIGQTVEYSFPHSGLGGQSGDEVTRLWTWNGPTMGWVSNGTRQLDLDYITRTEAIDIFVNESGDTMTGTLTGPHLNFDTGFIGTLTGEKASFRNTQDGRASLEVAIGSTGYTDNFWDFVAGTIVNEEGLTSNVFGVSTTSHSEIPSAGAFNGNLRVGQPTYNEKARLEVFGSISTTGNNNSSVLSTFRSPTLFRGSTGQDSNWEGGENNLTSGSGYDEDLNVSLRAFNDVVLGRAHRNSNTPITFPREFITKEYGEDNFGSGTMTILTDPTDHPATSTSPAIFRTLRIFKMRKPNGDLLTYQLDDTYLYFNDDYDSGRYGRYYEFSPQIIELQNKDQLPNFGWASLNQNVDGDPLFSSAGLRRQSEYQISGPGTKYYYSGNVETHETVPDDEVWYFLASYFPSGAIGDSSLRNSSAHIQIMTYSD